MWRNSEQITSIVSYVLYTICYDIRPKLACLSYYILYHILVYHISNKRTLTFVRNKTRKREMNNFDFFFGECSFWLRDISTILIWCILSLLLFGSWFHLFLGQDIGFFYVTGFQIILNIISPSLILYEMRWVLPHCSTLKQIEIWLFINFTL